MYIVYCSIGIIDSMTDINRNILLIRTEPCNNLTFIDIDVTKIIFLHFCSVQFQIVNVDKNLFKLEDHHCIWHPNTTQL
jgi:hypothetical protein